MKYYIDLRKLLLWRALDSIYSTRSAKRGAAGRRAGAGAGAVREGTIIRYKLNFKNLTISPKVVIHRLILYI